MEKYRKKPVTVEAVRVTEDFIKAKSLGDTYQTIDGNTYRLTYTDAGILVETLEGNVAAGVGDWIIKGIHDELYPCKHDIFIKTYDLE